LTANREQRIGPIFFSERDPLIDIKSLVFLITRKDPNVTFAVHLAQRSYISATEALKYRNELHERLFLDDMKPTGGGKTVNLSAE
jgi:hypothetical protein